MLPWVHMYDIPHCKPQLKLLLDLAAFNTCGWLEQHFFLSCSESRKQIATHNRTARPSQINQPVSPHTHHHDKPNR